MVSVTEMSAQKPLSYELTAPHLPDSDILHCRLSDHITGACVCRCRSDVHIKAPSDPGATSLPFVPRNDHSYVVLLFHSFESP